MAKKLVRIIAMGVILIMCFGIFAGCTDAGLKPGAYVSDDGSRVVLSEDNEFTFIRGFLNYAPTGKYSIKGNKLTLKVTDDEKYFFDIKNGNLVYASDDDVIDKGTVFKLDEDK